MALYDENDLGEAASYLRKGELRAWHHGWKSGYLPRLCYDFEARHKDLRPSKRYGTFRGWIQPSRLRTQPPYQPRNNWSQVNPEYMDNALDHQAVAAHY